METLPSELKSYLLEFLPLKYRLSMATMNKDWYFASLSPTLQRKAYFSYTEPPKNQCSVSKKDSLDYSTFIHTLMKSQRRFIELILNKLNCEHLREAIIIKKLGDRIITLKLINLNYLSGKFMNAISHYCSNLESLEILTVHKFCGFNQEFLKIPSLKAISFDNVRMSDKCFNLIIHCAPNLEELSFNKCRITVDPLVINEYYPDFNYDDIEANYNSKLVLTDVNIINYLRVARNIKKLNLDDCAHLIQELPQHVKLNTLQGFSVRALYLPYFDFDLFGNTLNAHLSLKVLVLDNVPIDCLKYVSKLTNLNYLHLTYWIDGLVDENNEEHMNYHHECLSSLKYGIQNMKYLKTLTLRENFFCDHAFRFLQPQIPVETLISLNSLDLTIDSTFKLTDVGNQLECLRLVGCNHFKSNDFSFLLQHFTNLTKLGLTGCIEFNDDVLKKSPISNIKGLTVLHLLQTKLTYLSLLNIKLFHLRQLHMNLTLKPTIQSKGIMSRPKDFEECLKYLSKHNPNLEYIEIDIPREEKEYILKNKKLLQTFTNTMKYKRHFKHLVEFRMCLRTY